MSIFNNMPKILRWPHRMKAYRDGLEFAPVTMEFDLTNKCNLNCPHCQDAGIDRSVEVPTETAMDWLKQLRDYGVEGVLFSGGGEPLMHPEAADIISYTHTLGLRSAVVTNGALITLDIANCLVDICEWVRVSIGMDHELYAHTKMLANASRREDDTGCTVGLAYLVNATTKRWMHWATVHAAASGVHYIQFRPYHNDFTPIDDVLPMLRQYETDTFKVLCSEQKYARFGPPPWRDYDYCHSSHFSAVVQANGDVVPCCHTRNQPELVFGNMHEQTFAEIWLSEKRREVLKSIDVSKCVPFCHGDEVNRVLTKAMTPQQHEAFV